MYATDVRQTSDVRQTDVRQKHRLMPSPISLSDLSPESLNTWLVKLEVIAMEPESNRNVGRINFGLKPKFSLKLKFKLKLRSKRKIKSPSDSMTA